MRVSTGESSRSWTSSVVAGGPAGEETLQKSELLRDRPRVGEMHGADPIEASFPHVGRASLHVDVRVSCCGTPVPAGTNRNTLDVKSKKALTPLSDSVVRSRSLRGVNIEHSPKLISIKSQKLSSYQVVTAKIRDATDA